MDVLSNLWYIHYYTFCFIFKGMASHQIGNLTTFNIDIWYYGGIGGVIIWLGEKNYIWILQKPTYVPQLCLSMAVSLNFHPIITTHGRSDARDSEYSCYNID